MNTNWPNYWIPGLIAVFIASGIGQCASEVWSTWLGWVVGIAAFLVLWYYLIVVVGFFCGLFGIEPYEMTEQFAKGWDRGMKLTNRQGRWH